MLAAQQIDEWQGYWQRAKADAKWTQWLNEHLARRQEIQGELLELLYQYLEDGIDTEAFRSTFDTRTRTDWVGFGLKGLSGAMFLNKLVKHIPDTGAVTRHLRAALPAPIDVEGGRQQMQTLLGWLEEVINSGQSERRQIQPGRTPFFVSAWWHLQNIEDWPIFYESARKAFRMTGIYAPGKELLDRYFDFRNVSLDLRSALDLHPWQLEQLAVRVANDEIDSDLEDTLEESQLQQGSVSPRIFISYRREDSDAWAGRLYDRLIRDFDEEQIFMDIDDLRPGEDFVQVIEDAVMTCAAMIVLIGEQWLSVTDEHGEPRLENPEDWVRLEVSTGLGRDISVVPVLIGGARMPRSIDLPENLAPLARRHALKISHDRFHGDVEPLVELLNDVLKTS